MRREGAIGLFVATTVMIGTVGTPLELSGTLKICQLLRVEEQLGSEVIGTRPGTAKQCCAEYWHCSKEQVMEYLGFSKRESDNHHFMSARTVSASIGCPHPPVVPPPFHVNNQF